MLFYRYMYRENGSVVEIYLDNTLYTSASLNQNIDISIIKNDEVCNVVSICDGFVSVISSHCPDHLCIKQHNIFLNNESICCLPNGLLVTVKSDTYNEYDAIVQ